MPQGHIALSFSRWSGPASTGTRNTSPNQLAVVFWTIQKMKRWSIPPSVPSTDLGAAVISGHAASISTSRPDAKTPTRRHVKTLACCDLCTPPTGDWWTPNPAAGSTGSHVQIRLTSAAGGSHARVHTDVLGSSGPNPCQREPLHLTTTQQCCSLLCLVWLLQQFEMYTETLRATPPYKRMMFATCLAWLLQHVANFAATLQLTTALQCRDSPTM